MKINIFLHITLTYYLNLKTQGLIYFPLIFKTIEFLGRMNEKSYLSDRPDYFSEH